MNLTVLVDNNARIDKNLLAEPALSFYIEIDNQKILFDCGYSDVIIKNAYKLKIDLLNIDNIVFSHAHNDHTNGLFYLKKIYQDSIDFKIKFNSPEIIAVSDIFTPIFQDKVGNISFPFEKSHLKEIFNLKLSDEPIWINPKLCFLGKINSNCKYNGNHIDESSLAYVSNGGLVIITGCSHVGLENIIEQAKKVTNIDKIKTIIGGFHFINKKEFELKNIINYLKQQNIKELYPCHCVDLNSKITLSKYFIVNEVCVGDKFDF